MTPNCSADEFNQLLQSLSPASRKAIARQLRVEVGEEAELSTVPRWWVLVVPEGAEPVVLGSHSEEELLAIVRANYEMDLGSLFIFYGTRAMTAVEDHGPAKVPYLVFPGGRMQPLYAPARQLQLQRDGFVGDDQLREYLAAKPGGQEPGGEDADDPLQQAADLPGEAGDYSHEEYAADGAEASLDHQVEEAYGTAEDAPELP